MTHNEHVLAQKSDDQLVEEIRACEATMRATLAKQARFIAEGERRGLHTRAGARSSSAWLRRLLNLQDRDARSRVLVAHKANASVGGSGERVPAELPATASALEEGSVSVAQARVIVDEMGRLPAWVSEQQRVDADVFLADQAKMLPPRELRVVATRVRHDLDPERESEERRQVEARRLRLATGSDGMTVLKGRLDRETGTRLRDALDRFAVDPDSAMHDIRSEPQRQADGLAQLVEFGLSEGGSRDTYFDSVASPSGDNAGASGQSGLGRACVRWPASHGDSARSGSSPGVWGASGVPVSPRPGALWDPLSRRSPLRRRPKPVRRAGSPGKHLVRSRWCGRPPLR